MAAIPAPRDRASVAEPQLGPFGIAMAPALAEVAVDRKRRPGAKGDGSWSAAFAEHRRRLVAQVDRLER